MKRLFTLFFFFCFCACNSYDRVLDNGDLDSTFLGENGTLYNRDSLTQTRISDSLYEITKTKFIRDGWLESSLPDGQLPDCYNFKPSRSSIDNYLEVKVGSGTDIVIKLMRESDSLCIRYVFVNSGATYKIKNIPEGFYFLKIAYGRNWFSKSQNGYCFGKFLRNSFYKLGEDRLDFFIKNESDGYRVPSFRLELDVVSMNSIETFASKEISQEEFNK